MTCGECWMYAHCDDGECCHLTGKTCEEGEIVQTPQCAKCQTAGPGNNCSKCPGTQDPLNPWPYATMELKHKFEKVGACTCERRVFDHGGWFDRDVDTERSLPDTHCPYCGDLLTDRGIARSDPAAKINPQANAGFWEEPVQYVKTVHSSLSAGRAALDGEKKDDSL